MSPQNSYVEALIHNVIVFGDRGFKEVIRIDEVRGCTSNSTRLVSPQEEEDTEDRLDEDTASRWQSASQGERPHAGETKPAYTLLWGHPASQPMRKQKSVV